MDTSVQCVTDTVDAEIDNNATYKQLSNHMFELTESINKINSHCYEMDSQTLVCSETIEKEFNDITEIIENRKKLLISQLHQQQNKKMENAKNIYKTISNELQECHNAEIVFTKSVMNPKCIEDIQIAKENINNLCQNIKHYDIDTTKIGKEIQFHFCLKQKKKATKSLKYFGDLRNISEYQKNKLKNEIDLNQINNVDVNKRKITVPDTQIAWREKQIEIGKKSLGYQNLIKEYPKYKERKWREKNRKEFVKIPKVTEQIGKKRWQGKLCKWRQFLHQYDN